LQVVPQRFFRAVEETVNQIVQRNAADGIAGQDCGVDESAADFPPLDAATPREAIEHGHDGCIG
jgi:hypothetical protein